MNPDDAQNQQTKYRQAVAQLVCCGGLFIITSCNWTQAELLQQFDAGNKISVIYVLILKETLSYCNSCNSMAFCTFLDGVEAFNRV